MQLFRFALLLPLLVAVVYFAYYAATGEERYKASGLKLLKWAVLAGLGFFGVLILERLL